MQKQRTSDWILNPVFIFFVLWSTQILGHAVLADQFYSFETETWAALAVGFFAFVLGSYIASTFGNSGRQSTALKVNTAPRMVSVYLVLLLPIYIAFVVAPNIYNFVSNPDLLFSEIRNSMVDSVSDNDRSVILGLYLHYVIVFLSIITISYSRFIKNGVLIYVITFGIIAGLLTFGRNILLLYFISLGVILYLQGKISKKMTLLIGLFFVVGFFALAMLLGKGGNDDGWVESVAWNFKVYVLGGFAAFNNYIAIGEPNITGSLLMPNFLKELVSVFGFRQDATPNLLPFVEVPLPVNVYTVFFPWYHDGGFVGVLFGFMVIGFVTMKLFLARYRSELSMLVYSISLYPLVMMIFEEQYIRAYPLWGLIIIIVASMLILERISFRNLRTIS